LGEEGISSTIGKLVPAVSGADKDTLGNTLHDVADIGVELRSSQVTTVESLRANGDGVNGFLITGDGFLDGGPIGLEGRLLQQVVLIGGLANPREKEKYQVRKRSQW
jgi:hypothetical protein